MTLRTRLRFPHLVLLFAALLAIACSPRAFAQADGAIAGTVTDPNGAILQGAQITLLKPSMIAATNEQGRFYVNGLAPGTYNLTVSYVGLKSFSKSVTVTAGQTATVDVTLKLPNDKEAVVVNAGRVSAEAEALNIERASDNLEQVMPNEIITSLPNANLADALGRMPSVTLERDEGEGKYVQVRSTEPRLTNTTVDGVNVPSEEPGVRQIKFDAIPASLVDSVQVSKTLQANMEGDGIGGSVNLVTKTASDTPTIELSGLGGYTNIANGRGNTTETATVGRRFGASKKLGIMLGGSYDWEGRGIDDIEPVPDVATFGDGSSSTWFDAMDIREYLYFRSRWGLAGSADYRIRSGSHVYARFLYSSFLNAGNRYAYSLSDNTPGISLLNAGNDGCGGAATGPCGGVPSFGTQLRHPRINLGNVVLGGNHVFGKTWYAWEANVGHASYGDVPYTSASFNSNLETSSCQYASGSTKDQYLPQWTKACYDEAYSHPEGYTLDHISRSLGTAAQLNLGAGGSGAVQYHFGNRSAVLEYGGKFRNEHKYADTYEQTITPNGSISMTTFPNRFVYKHFYNGGQYPIGYAPQAADILSYANSHSADFAYDSTKGQDPSQFSLMEKVSAGYVMNTIDFANGIRFIAGLRAEYTHDNVHNLAFGDTGVSPNAFKGSYYTILPSASLRFNAGPDSYVRLIYARGLSRPDPQDIAQPLQWTVSGNGANKYSVTFGNANLKAETGDDVDVLFDHYLKPFGIISVGYFYKSLQNPIVYHTYQLANYLPPGAPPQDQGNYLATQPVNAGSAWLSGFEASYLQHYSSLPGFLSGLGLSANYSYIGSRTSGIPGRSDNPRLLRNSPNVFNVSPTYDRGRYSMRLGVSYNQASIYGYQYQDGMPGGVNGPLSDIYFYSHVQVDAQGTVNLHRGFSLLVSGLNLNNEVFGFYQGSAKYMIQREYYQPTYSFGLRWTSGKE